VEVLSTVIKYGLSPTFIFLSYIKKLSLKVLRDSTACTNDVYIAPSTRFAIGIPQFCALKIINLH
jgi:hypothetical protein